MEIGKNLKELFCSNKSVLPVENEWGIVHKFKFDFSELGRTLEEFEGTLKEFVDSLEELEGNLWALKSDLAADVDILFPDNCDVLQKFKLDPEGNWEGIWPRSE